MKKIMEDVLMLIKSVLILLAESVICSMLKIILKTQMEQNVLKVMENVH